MGQQHLRAQELQPLAEHEQQDRRADQAQRDAGRPAEREAQAVEPAPRRGRLDGAMPRRGRRRRRCTQRRHLATTP
jgi:hypothetical protein